MRIIGGEYKGRKVELAPSQSARPTADRVREALFSILYDRVDGACVLDLFAGTGLVGLEALSRGASHCVFCDREKSAVEALRANLQRLGTDPSRYALLEGDYTVLCARLAREGRAFSFIYLDPPYDGGYYEDALTRCSPLLEDTGILAAEHRTGTSLPQAVSGLFMDREKRYGTQTISFYQKGGADEPLDISRQF